MIRIPNASPIALFTNFETNCTCYFHPNVLIYTLRNRIAYLARNHKIFNFSSFNQNYQHLTNKNYTHNNFNSINTNINEINTNLNNIHSSFNDTNDCVDSDGINLSENLKNEVYQILYSLLSCIDYIKPQSTCTILLSLIKLRFFDEELIKLFIENFKFDEANPKTISLFFLSCSKLYINKNILKNIINFILNTINTNTNTNSQCTTVDSQLTNTNPNTDTNTNPFPNLEYSKKDIICILGSLKRIINKNQFKLKSIINLYNKLLEKLSIHLKDCNIIELTEVLESFHTMNSNEYYTNVINQIINNSSLITFNNIYKIFKIINTKSRLKLNKHSLNNQLLIHYLDKLHINELIMIINDFNIYTTDDFVIQFSNQLLNTLYVDTRSNLGNLNTTNTLNIRSNLDKNLKNLNTTNTLNTLNQDNLNKNRKNWENVNILEIIKYYNRRYETSISREYYLINKILKGIKPEYDIKKVNEISNLCGYIYEILQGDNYNIQRCIINKYIIKYNYQSFFQ